jgi:hypothetical protein
MIHGLFFTIGCLILVLCPIWDPFHLGVIRSLFLEDVLVEGFQAALGPDAAVFWAQLQASFRLRVFSDLALQTFLSAVWTKVLSQWPFAAVIVEVAELSLSFSELSLSFSEMILSFSELSLWSVKLVLNLLHESVASLS